MSMEAATGPLNAADQLRYARQIIQIEAEALDGLGRRLDTEFCRAANELYQCPGSAIVTGIGKAGLIGQKIAATLASTGTRSHFLHAGEAVHGDLGRIHRTDLMLILSHSGETQEVVRLLPALAALGVPIIAVTGHRSSTLARAAHITLDLGPLKEACSLGLAPSTSTTAMLAIGDALALVVSRMRSFGREDFARFHPGGSLGRQLAKVEEQMRPLADCRVAHCSQSVRQVLVERRRPTRRTGAVMIVDPDGILRGIFTDSDLARLFESHRDEALDGPIRQVMTKRPTTVPAGSMVADAVEIMAERKISELPVVDGAGKPVGLIDITDIVALYPEGDLAGIRAGERSPEARAGQPPRPKNPAFVRRTLKTESPRSIAEPFGPGGEP
ncbi:MAG TPA: KpsF/GutQ family sugar-phosphate isomerase [Pirellulales bacterium]|nr:KpsF/GutQ family sugar-phosphate isomerase [Pirellulales bacterium]